MEVIFLQLFSSKQNGDILKTKCRYTFTCHVDLFVFNGVTICCENKYDKFDNNLPLSCKVSWVRISKQTTV